MVSPTPSAVTSVAPLCIALAHCAHRPRGTTFTCHSRSCTTYPVSVERWLLPPRVAFLACYSFLTVTRKDGRVPNLHKLVFILPNLYFTFIQGDQKDGVSQRLPWIHHFIDDP